MGYSHPRWSSLILTTVVSILGFTALAVQGARATGAVKAAFSLIISAPQSSVKSGAPVWIEVTMANNSNHRIAVTREPSEDLDQGGWVYEVDVHGDKGGAPPQTEYARNIINGGLRSTGLIPLYPGKTIIDRVNVSKLYDLSRPGTYTIQVQEFDVSSSSPVMSNKITVKVTP